MLPSTHQQHASTHNRCHQRQQCCRMPGRLNCKPPSALTQQQATTTSDLMSLVPFAIRNGIQFAKIKPSLQPDSGRGLIATSDIQPGECICNVPVAAAIRVYPGCPAVLRIPQPLWQQLPWYAQLALTLLNEQQQGPASKFADYIKQLPQAPVDVPALWTEDVVQQLRCGYFIQQVHQQQQDWADLQQQLDSHLSAAGISTAQLLWALSVTRSRAFAAPYVSSPFGQIKWLNNKKADKEQHQQQQQHVLCPLLDLFNHCGSVQSECEFYSDFRSSAFRVVASQRWARDEEVFISYGAGSNDALLQLYGFVENNNQGDRYIVRSLPAVLQGRGHRADSTEGDSAVLEEVVFTSDGLSAAAAQGVLQAVSAEGGQGGHAAPVPAGSEAGGFWPYAALDQQVKAVCAAAIQQELAVLAVDAAADQEVLQAFESLPTKQAELSSKQADLQKAMQRLQQLQQLLEGLKGTSEDSSVSDTVGQQQQQQQEQQQQQSQTVAVSQQQQQKTAVEAVVPLEPPRPPDQESAMHAELLSTLQLCRELCARLEAEVQALNALLERWTVLTQQCKHLAVAYRLQKYNLLAHVLQQLL